MSDIKSLLHSGKILQPEYDSYILFELDEFGREYLKNIIEATFLEPSDAGKMEHTFAWHAGRQSVWREIKTTILKINYLLGEENDRTSQPGNNPNTIIGREFIDVDAAHVPEIAMPPVTCSEIEKSKIAVPKKYRPVLLRFR